MPDFFQIGGTLPSDSPSYIERQADRDLLAGLCNNDFCHILSSRQVGKSSLIVRIASKLREQKIAAAIVDLTVIGSKGDEEQWYYGILAEIGGYLNLTEELNAFWEYNQRFAPVQRWGQALEEVVLKCIATPVVIFFDEIDYVSKLAFSTDDFFAAIRACYNQRANHPEYRRLTFCLSGSTTPEQLISRPDITPFNIGQGIELTDFTEDEAIVIAAKLAREDSDGRQLLRRILYWTNGHPYLTQELSAAVAHLDKSPLTSADVDAACQRIFLSQKAVNSEKNFAFVSHRLLEGASDLTALLNVYRDALVKPEGVRDNPADPLHSLLKLSGIVKVEFGVLKVRNRIYEQVFDQKWITDHLPGAEQRRIRAAALRATIITTLIAVLILGLIAIPASIAWQQYQKTKKLSGELANSNQSLNKINQLLNRQNNKLDDQNRELLQTSKVLYNTIHKLNAEKQTTAKLSANLLEENKAKQRTILKLNLEQKQTNRLLYDSDMYLTQQAYDRGDYELAHEIWWQNRNNPERGCEWGFWYRNFPRLKKLIGHTGAVSAIAISKDGRRIVTGGGSGPDYSIDKIARVWDARTGKELLRLTGHSSEVHSVAISQDGKFIVTGSYDSTARVWDAHTGKELFPPLKHPGSVFSVAISSDGTRIVTGCSDSYVPKDPVIARIWDAHTGKELMQLKEGTTWGATSIAISQDGKLIITGGSSGDTKVRIWDAESGKESPVPLEHPNWIWSVAISQDGSRIITGCADNIARVWDVPTGQLLHELKGHTEIVTSVAISADGKRIITGSEDATARLWDADTGEELIPPFLNSGVVWAVAISEDGQHILTGGDDYIVREWNVLPEKERLPLLTHSAPVSAIAISKDGRRVVTGGGNVDHSFVHVWDAETRKELRPPMIFPPGNSIPISADGSRFITQAASQNGSNIVRKSYVWDSWTGKQLLELIGHTDNITSIAISHNASFIVTGSEDKTVRVWDAKTGKALLPPMRLPVPVASVVISEDGMRIVAGGKDRTVHVWNARTGKELLRITGHTDAVNSVVISADGTRIVTGSEDKTVRVWDAKTGKALLPPMRLPVPVASVVISADGKRIISGSGYDFPQKDDVMACVWDAQTGKELLQLRLPASPPILVAISSDGRRIVTGSSFDEVFVWMCETPLDGNK